MPASAATDGAGPSSPAGEPATGPATDDAGRLSAAAPDPATDPATDPFAGPAADTDAAVRAAQRGSEAAFAALYRAIQPGLVRYLTTLVGNYAEDVASETWGQVSRDLAKFSGTVDNFRGWVTTIGRNRALDHLRAQSRRPAEPVAPEDLYGTVGDHDTADAALEAISTSTAIALIGALPHEQAEAVMLRVVMGLSAKTAAEVLGKQPGAVRTLTYRGLRTLAARLERSQR